MNILYLRIIIITDLYYFIIILWILNVFTKDVSFMFFFCKLYAIHWHLKYYRVVSSSDHYIILQLKLVYWYASIVFYFFIYLKISSIIITVINILYKGIINTVFFLILSYNSRFFRKINTFTIDIRSELTASARRFKYCLMSWRCRMIYLQSKILCWTVIEGIPQIKRNLGILLMSNNANQFHSILNVIQLFLVTILTIMFKLFKKKPMDDLDVILWVVLSFSNHINSVWRIIYKASR